MAFLGPNDFLIAEKNTGQVKRVVNGVVQSTVLDLAVNNASERGLLGMALHPNFPTNPGVYLFWSCRSTVEPSGDPFLPEELVCSDDAISGLPDSADTLQVPLRGNRVDRFEWNGSALVYRQNLLMLRSFQHDGGPDPPGQATQRSRRGATITAVSSRSVPTGSSTSPSATSGGGARCRTSKTGPRRRPTTISSAVGSRTMRT
jgi:Glucose / Sorbosone dehydrogenase